MKNTGPLKNTGPRGRRRPVLIVVACAVLAFLWLDALSGTLSSVPDGWARAAVLIAAGPGLVLSAPLMLAAAYRFRGRAVTGTGVVVACEDGYLRDTGYDLTVRFTAPDGRERSFTAHSGRRREVGGRVRIRYDPGDPAEARLYTHPAADLAGALLSLVVGGVGCILLWLHYRGG
ncbi:DUF3592 domain-containing protein [Actinomadura sp. 21ATH]|uniref:DUF3592 domain-containing protein n=1 Tax=Actinomadura sp. 21ATH TaxID=1735444 RepID=UPI0035C1BE16